MLSYRYNHVSDRWVSTCGNYDEKCSKCYYWDLPCVYSSKDGWDTNTMTFEEYKTAMKLYDPSITVDKFCGNYAHDILMDDSLEPYNDGDSLEPCDNGDSLEPCNDGDSLEPCNDGNVSSVRQVHISGCSDEKCTNCYFWGFPCVYCKENSQGTDIMTFEEYKEQMGISHIKDLTYKKFHSMSVSDIDRLRSSNTTVDDK